MKKPKAKKAKDKQPDHFEKIEARHNFSDEEKLVMLSELTRLNQQKESLAEEAKASAKSWKSRIESVALQVKNITNNASNGYEMRPTECRVEFNPKKGIKTYFRKDDGTEVETREMTPADYELPLFRDDAKLQGKPGENLVPVADAFKQAEELDKGQSPEGDPD